MIFDKFICRPSPVAPTGDVLSHPGEESGPNNSPHLRIFHLSKHPHQAYNSYALNEHLYPRGGRLATSPVSLSRYYAPKEYNGDDHERFVDDRLNPIKHRAP